MRPSLSMPLTIVDALNLDARRFHDIVVRGWSTTHLTIYTSPYIHTGVVRCFGAILSELYGEKGRADTSRNTNSETPQILCFMALLFVSKTATVVVRKTVLPKVLLLRVWGGATWEESMGLG